MAPWAAPTTVALLRGHQPSTRTTIPFSTRVSNLGPSFFKQRFPCPRCWPSVVNISLVPGFALTSETASCQQAASGSVAVTPAGSVYKSRWRCCTKTFLLACFALLPSKAAATAPLTAAELQEQGWLHGPLGCTQKRTFGCQPHHRILIIYAILKHIPTPQTLHRDYHWGVIPHTPFLFFKIFNSAQVLSVLPLPFPVASSLQAYSGSPGEQWKVFKQFNPEEV